MRIQVGGFRKVSAGYCKQALVAATIAPHPAAEARKSMLQESRNILRKTWADLLPAGTPCALALYPDHWNAGDSAIWWGTRNLLAELGVEVCYGCDPWSYDPVELRCALPDGPVLLLGGGNFGDVYPREESLRDRILSDFRSRRIIQLPQSIWFRNVEGIDRMATLLGAQSDFTLLLRDRESLEFARAYFPQTRTQLCPDASLALELPEAIANPEAPVLALWRNDAESSAALPGVPSDWIVRDWTLSGGELPLQEASQMSGESRDFRQWIGKLPPWPPSGDMSRVVRRRDSWRDSPWRWDHLAEERTMRACRILSQGRVVLTNRLHGHLLSLLIGKPHVVCDTANRKISAYFQTWSSDRSLIDNSKFSFASTPEEAVRALANHTQSTTPRS